MSNKFKLIFNFAIQNSLSDKLLGSISHLNVSIFEKSIGIALRTKRLHL